MADRVYLNDCKINWNYYPATIVHKSLHNHGAGHCERASKWARVLQARSLRHVKYQLKEIRLVIDHNMTVLASRVWYTSLNFNLIATKISEGIINRNFTALLWAASLNNKLVVETQRESRNENNYSQHQLNETKKIDVQDQVNLSSFFILLITDTPLYSQRRY